jgi:hypothetical protein
LKIEDKHREDSMEISKVLLNAISLVAILSAAEASAEVPSAIAVTDATMVASFHAEGAQIYECKAGPGSALTWQFREPIATLIVGGQTIGRHYAGPNWDHVDGSGVKAKAAATTPGTALNDIPWLRLDVTDHRGSGILSNVTTVQRINTKGGVIQGPCESVGGYRSVPYSADYVFLRRSD